MEDDIFFENGRRPNFFKTGRRSKQIKKNIIEDDLYLFSPKELQLHRT